MPALPTLLMLLSIPVVAAAQAKFAEPPKAVVDGKDVAITFAAEGATDVEVGVLDAGGRVVRHLDARAAIRALKTGRLGYLGLDVYEEEADLFFEDLSDTVIQDDVFARLLTFPNVIVTAHQAFFTADALRAIAATTLGSIAAFEAGKALTTEVTMEKVAVTLLAAFITNEQEVPVPLHAPLKPAKVEPAAGVAVSMTLVPRAKGALQAVPQLIPLGTEVTVPLPLPGLLIDSENVEPALSHWCNAAL
jgi:hypothetical protein